MSKLEKKYGAWIYTSDRGNKYTIGQITEEYNVIIDEFDDIIELFDADVLVHDKLITYFYGDMDDKDTTEYADKIIDHYDLLYCQVMIFHLLHLIKSMKKCINTVSFNELGKLGMNNQQ